MTVIRHRCGAPLVGSTGTCFVQVGRKGMMCATHRSREDALQGLRQEAQRLADAANKLLALVSKATGTRTTP